MTKTEEIKVNALLVARKIAEQRWDEALEDMKRTATTTDNYYWSRANGACTAAREITLAIDKAIERIRGY